MAKLLVMMEMIAPVTRLVCKINLKFSGKSKQITNINICSIIVVEVFREKEDSLYVSVSIKNVF